MKTNTLDWDSLTQGEARTALRNMLELGQLKNVLSSFRYEKVD